VKIAVNTSLESLLGSELSLLPNRPDEPASVALLRRQAREAFAAGGFEVRGREEWKYTDLKAVIAGGFRPTDETAPDSPSAIDLPAAGGAWRLVFLNGRFQSDASRTVGLPDGVTLSPMSQALNLDGLGELAGFSEAPFAALNTAAWQDGLFLDLPEGTILEHPVELHFLTDDSSAGRLVAPRTLIRAGGGARATVIEFFSSSTESAVLNAPVTEIICAEKAEVKHWKVIREGGQGLHYGSTHVRQETGSSYLSREFNFGGANVRRELHVDLAGAEAACDVTSLAMAGDTQRMDMRTRINHRAPGCTTNELYKGIYDHKARGVFDGLIHVFPDAQQTAAHQTNRNLLLSDDASISSIPRLEIYADDVKCSHGSTTGQLDEEQIFFLRTRGFDSALARTMLTQAFAGEIVDGVDSPELRRVLNEEIARRLGVGEPVEATR
jgi:Fe-S cluster assembly protein SufD